MQRADKFEEGGSYTSGGAAMRKQAERDSKRRQKKQSEKKTKQTGSESREDASK